MKPSTALGLASLALAGCTAVPGGFGSNRTTWSMAPDAVGCVGVNDENPNSTVRVYLKPFAGFNPGEVLFRGSDFLPPGWPIVVRTAPAGGLPPYVANSPPQYGPGGEQELIGNARRAVDACIRGGGGTGYQILGSVAARRGAARLG